MDPVIQNAIRRRSELRNELRDIDKFLELYQQFKGRRHPRQMTMDVDAPPVDSGEQIEDERTNQPTDLPTSEVSGADDEAPGLTRQELRPHILAAILDAGKPLTRGQLLQRLDARKARVGGKYDRSKNMGTILWRLRDDFVNLQGRGYWPRGLPFPEAGYDPADPNSPEANDHALRQSQPAGDA